MPAVTTDEEFALAFEVACPVTGVFESLSVLPLEPPPHATRLETENNRLENTTYLFIVKSRWANGVHLVTPIFLETRSIDSYFWIDQRGDCCRYSMYG